MKSNKKRRNLQKSGKKPRYRFGAWYIEPKSWVKMPKEQPLEDPKENKFEVEEVEECEELVSLFGEGMENYLFLVRKVSPNTKDLSNKKDFQAIMLHCSTTQNNELAAMRGTKLFVEFAVAKHKRKPQVSNTSTHFSNDPKIKKAI